MKYFYVLGTLFTMTGRIYTDIFGPNNHTSSNGMKTRFLRTYMGGQRCEIKNTKTIEDSLFVFYMRKLY